MNSMTYDYVNDMKIGSVRFKHRGDIDYII